MLSHRVQLHEDLKRKATSPDGAGIPAVLKTASIVRDVDPETATVTLEDGSSFSGDLVLGADGVSVCDPGLVADGLSATVCVGGHKLTPVSSPSPAKSSLVLRLCPLDPARARSGLWFPMRKSGRAPSQRSWRSVRDT